MADFLPDVKGLDILERRTVQRERRPSGRALEGSHLAQARGARRGVTSTPGPVVPHTVTRLERNANITAVVIPFLGVIAAAVLLWHRFLGPRDLRSSRSCTR